MDESKHEECWNYLRAMAITHPCRLQSEITNPMRSYRIGGLIAYVGLYRRLDLFGGQLAWHASIAATGILGVKKVCRLDRAQKRRMTELAITALLVVGVSPGEVTTSDTLLHLSKLLTEDELTSFLGIHQGLTLPLIR